METQPQIEQSKHPKPLKVLGIMSLPRLTFTDNMSCSFKAFGLNGLDMTWYTGAFWEKGIQSQLERAIEMGFDVVVTIDYDSVYRPEDVTYLLRCMQWNDWIDALFPVQVKRNTYEILFSEGDQGRPNIPLDAFSADVTPALIGHFGLTALRLSSIAKLPKPWLVTLPDAKGEWSEDCTDGDIFFWRHCRKHNLGVYQANRCHIGHIERFIVWPDANMQPVLQAVGEKGWVQPPASVGALTPAEVNQTTAVIASKSA